MHCLSPKMVCETKIVAEDHESLSGAKKETIIVSSSQMWPSLSGAPAAPPSAPADEGDPQEEGVRIREFHPAEQEVVRRIFYEGIMERIPNTAFRGLKDQPFTQLVYGTMAVICFVVTNSLLLTCCLPIFLMGMRYYFSRKVILNYLECALNTDMSDIEQYYMKSPGEKGKHSPFRCWRLGTRSSSSEGGDKVPPNLRMGQVHQDPTLFSRNILETLGHLRGDKTCSFQRNILCSEKVPPSGLQC
ncbi:N-acetylaspartate synthetase isoform X2 [Pogona vitticeps]